MNQLISSNTTLTMSSREIAAILGKQHTNIKISADRLAERGVVAPQETPYIDPQNKQTYHEYQLTKRDSLILVAQNCPEFTAKLVDRWQELEDGASIPKTLSSALRLAADQAEIIERQSLALAVAAPKIQFVDSYVEATGIKGIEWIAGLLAVEGIRTELEAA